MNNAEFYADLLQCIHETYLWHYDTEGTLLSSNCPQEERVASLISEELIRYFVDYTKEHSKPAIHSGVYETNWIIDPQKESGKVISVYLVGPFYIDSFPEGAIREQMFHKNLSIGYKEDVLNNLRKISVIGFTKIIDYTIMLHYAVNGERIGSYDLHVSVHKNETEKADDEELETKIHGTYDAEREMLRMVREGDLSVLEYLKKMSTIGNIGKLAADSSEPLRQFRNALLVNIVLFSRAAIEGGLYTETAMTLTDYYFQAVESAKSFQDLTDVAQTMQKDFVSRVHKIRTDSSRSKTIKDVIAYIELHLEDEFDLETLAGEFGYSEYYLTKKFRKETGLTIKEYIRNKKLERAAFYLKGASLSISEIADKLHFSSQSYFNTKFKEKYKVTPKEYMSGNISVQAFQQDVT